MHAAHLRAHTHGGPVVLENLEAWCARCNWAQGAQDVADTRVVPREWQLEALPMVVEAIAQTGAATVAAAPGAGKTVLAGLTFEQLRDADEIDRMVVFTPNLTLVEQWHAKLFAQRFLELGPGHAIEIPGQVGVVVTYQSLNDKSVETHRRAAAAKRTLVVLDEVHHVAERDDKTKVLPTWTRYVRQLIGALGSLEVAGVLNLSGTLWRSHRGQRISTVRYVEEADGKIRSEVDYEVTAQRLIGEGELRPVDLFRRSATVELVDLAEQTVTVSPIADLTGEASRSGAVGAVLRGLARDASWRESFVGAIIDRLERAYRDFGKGAAKALIVAPFASEARAFKETADTVMRKRGLVPLTDLAISADGKEAQQSLKRFKAMRRPGVLCTVNMASEGYDCDDIAVIGYATDKRTPLYVRQVVARAQRVTKYERETLKRPIPAAVVVPDVPELVELVRGILQPMRHELLPGEEKIECGPGTQKDPRYFVDGITDPVEQDAYATGTDDEGVAMDHIRAVEPHCRRVGLNETEALRMILAVRRGTRDWRDQDHFRPVPPVDAAVAATGAPQPPGPAAVPSPLSQERSNGLLRARLSRCEGWWKTRGDATTYPINHFVADCNRAGGIGRQERDSATPDQLKAALRYACDRIRRYCEETGQPPPDWLSQGEDADA
jgi:superfamily II DNA or RNA helicase